jgi:hypothetical protein
MRAATCPLGKTSSGGRLLSLSVFTVAMGETALRQKVTSFRRLLQRNVDSGEGPTDPLVAAGQELFATLIEPAQALIAASAQLMMRLYTHLKAGKTKDAALRAAQLELIRMRRSQEAAWRRGDLPSIPLGRVPAVRRLAVRCPESGEV